jgi:hypothetical protein
MAEQACAGDGVANVNEVVTAGHERYHGRDSRQYVRAVASAAENKDADSDDCGTERDLSVTA